MASDVALSEEDASHQDHSNTQGPGLCVAGIPRPYPHCPTLQACQWSLSGQLADNVYYISHSQKFGERFIAKPVSLLGLSQAHRAGLVTRLQRYKEQLKHDYLQSVLDVVEDVQNNRILVVCDYCEGGSLQSLIVRAKTYDEVLNEIEVMDWLVQALTALEHLDMEGLVHSKINCSNILLSNNSAKLTEPQSLRQLMKHPARATELSDSTVESFDLSKVTDAELPYIAPEVLKGEELSDKADVWSLGCVLYELCAKKRLFLGKSREDVSGKVQTAKLRRWPRMFSAELEQVWLRMLHTDPILRPNAFELLKTPFLAEHYQEMKNTSVVIVDQSECSTQNWDRDIQSRLGNCDVFSDTDFGVDADLELTEEETLQLLNLGKR